MKNQLSSKFLAQSFRRCRKLNGFINEDFSFFEFKWKYDDYWFNFGPQN